MTWVREGLAGPSPDAGPDSFSLAPLEQAADDLVALIEHERPDVLIGYDDEGTYGHPDHVRAHHLAVAASERTGVPLVQIASEIDAPGAAVREHPGVAPAVEAAVDSYRTQLTLVGPVEGGFAIRHVGGQDDVVALRTALRG
jgi:N-acetyl-1-D-myo-inositol-2-amino-2-deoxy-alpha-D-glucopyranoside deacetylase